MAKPKPQTCLRRMPNGPRNHLVALVGEFTGTFLFLSVPAPSSAVGTGSLTSSFHLT